jgi:hypothetical protein
MLIHRSVCIGAAEALASLSGEQRRAIQFMEGCVQSWPFQTITSYCYLGARPRAAASGPCPPSFAGKRMDILVPPVSMFLRKFLHVIVFTGNFMSYCSYEHWLMKQAIRRMAAHGRLMQKKYRTVLLNNNLRCTKHVIFCTPAIIQG